MALCTIPHTSPISARAAQLQQELDQVQAVLHDAWMRADASRRAVQDRRTLGRPRDVYHLLLWDLSFEEWRPVKVLVLARALGFTTRKGSPGKCVRLALKALVALGYLERQAGGVNAPNQYRLTWVSPLLQQAG